MEKFTLLYSWFDEIILQNRDVFLHNSRTILHNPVSFLQSLEQIGS